MIEVAIPQDIRKYEAQAIGPFSLRQLASLGGVLAVAYGVYFLEKAAGIDPMTVPLFMIFPVPIALFGWYKPYGMHFEEFVGKAFQDNFMAPKVRKYKIENTWDVIIEEKEKERISKARAEARENNEKYKAETKKPFKEIPRNKLPQELRPYK